MPNDPTSLLIDSQRARRSQRVVVRQQKSLEALDRCVAIWTARVADGGWDYRRDGHAKDTYAIKKHLIGVGEEPNDGSVGFLDDVLVRCESLLDLIADQPAGGRSSLSTVGLLMDVDDWLSGFPEHPSWAGASNLDALLMRRFLLEHRVESHPVWPTAVALGAKRDKSPVFSRILMEIGTWAVRFDKKDHFYAGSVAGDLALDVFRRSLQRFSRIGFQGVTDWDLVRFANEAAVCKVVSHQKTLVARGTDTLLGGDTLLWVAGMFYGPRSKVDSLLDPTVKPVLFQRLVNLAEDAVVIAAVDAYPGLLDSSAVSVRFQRIALNASARTGRVRSISRL